MIQESKLTLNSRTPNIQNFTTVRKDRDQGQGGGLPTLIHKSINSSRSPDSPDTLTDPHLEELTITAKLGNTDLIITNVYIPPATSCTGGYNASLDQLMMTMDTLTLGDFNVHHSSWYSSLTDTRGTMLENMVSGSNFGILNWVSPKTTAYRGSKDNSLQRFQRQHPTTVPKTTAYNGSKDNSLQAVELSGHQTCKLLSSHPFKPFPRRFSGSESVCSG